MKTQLQATNKNSFDPFTLSENKMKINSSIPKMAAATAAALALNPVVAMAGEFLCSCLKMNNVEYFIISYTVQHSSSWIYLLCFTPILLCTCSLK